jgi:hypothetical protein
MPKPKNKKAKLKQYCVTQTIWVSFDVMAENEEDALQEFEAVINDPKRYTELIADSEDCTEVQCYDEPN